MGAGNTGGRSIDLGLPADFAGIAPDADPALAFASLDDCAACEGEGTTEGALYWSRSAGCYEARRVRCASCLGYGLVEVPTGEVELEDALALDAAADAALDLTATEPGFLPALCAAVADVAALLVGLVVVAVERGLVVARAEDERDGASVHLAGPDPRALVSTAAPVVELRRVASVTSRAA